MNLNLSSMDAKTAKELSPLISALANMNDVHLSTEKSQIGINNSYIQNKIQENYYMTQQQPNIVGML
jgi:hypothetical protein